MSESSDTLISRSKKPIHRYVVTQDNLLHKSLVLYGPSGSGKSTVIKHCLHVLKDKAPMVILISPTEQINPAFAGFIPDQCILPKMLLDSEVGKKEKEVDKVARYLRELMTRQEAITIAHRRANSVALLESLLSKCSSRIRESYKKSITKLQEKRIAIVHRVKRMPMDEILRVNYIEKIDSKLAELKNSVLKKLLLSDNARLQQLAAEGKLSEDEVMCLKCKESNPDLILILDDCADDFKDYCKLKEFKTLFYKGRHYSITLIVSCQDDTNLSPDLRKNAFVSMFTKPQVSTANFDKKSNGYQKDTTARAIDVIPKIFEEKYRVMVYDRMGDEFYYFKTPEVKKFRVGAKCLWDLCDALKSDEKAYISGNPYYAKLVNE